ncbi:MAG: hypothetical protein JSU66_01095 [Deltaproteobacteria bacterium]|nr:MAG: hypothetical protein JSU66_01095 [Deltaproteobacteria bacterium]
MGKAFGWILMLLALYIGMTIYTEGMDQAFGGIFAPLQSQNESDRPLATALTPLAQEADPPSAGYRPRRGSVTDRVRARVSADIEAGARRRGAD